MKLPTKKIVEGILYLSSVINGDYPEHVKSNAKLRRSDLTDLLNGVKK